MKYKLLDGRIVVEVVNGAGTIESNDLHFEGDEITENLEWEAAIDGLESMILACACEGIDVSSEAFQNAVRTSLQSIENFYG